jgi:hypothetical protein
MPLSLFRSFFAEYIKMKMGFVDVYVCNEKQAERMGGKSEAFNEAIKMLRFFLLLVIMYIKSNTGWA